MRERTFTIHSSIGFVVVDIKYCSNWVSSCVWWLIFCAWMYVFDRTVERSSYERQGSGAWMSPSLGRGYGGNDRSVGYSRQGSGNGVRTYEDKASFFPNPANIAGTMMKMSASRWMAGLAVVTMIVTRTMGTRSVPALAMRNLWIDIQWTSSKGFIHHLQALIGLGHPAEGVNYGPGDGQVMSARSLSEPNPVECGVDE